jgi:hypothetical protein
MRRARQLAGKALGGKALGGKALGGKALGGKALGGKALGGKALGGKALGGKALGGKALGGKASSLIPPPHTRAHKHRLGRSWAAPPAVRNATYLFTDADETDPQVSFFVLFFCVCLIV